ncbi:MAG TPA: SMI1/KNR4 family protein, partial [Gemmataceae bacterium]|nr:SMI1/KNR4 family protein [Gemmataceae bacterium]
WSGIRSKCVVPRSLAREERVSPKPNTLQLPGSWPRRRAENDTFKGLVECSLFAVTSTTGCRIREVFRFTKQKGEKDMSSRQGKDRDDKSSIVGVEFLKRKRRASNDRLIEFEKAVGTTLPDDYRSFLLQYNGGKPLRRVFQMEG